MIKDNELLKFFNDYGLVINIVTVLFTILLCSIVILLHWFGAFLVICLGGVTILILTSSLTHIAKDRHRYDR